MDVETGFPRLSSPTVISGRAGIWTPMFVILKAYNTMGWEKSNNFNVSLLFIQQTSTEGLLLLGTMLSTGDRAVGKNLVDIDNQTFIYK